MPDPVVTMTPDTLSVAPAGQVVTTLTVRNAGTLVQDYELSVLPPDLAQWTDVDPPRLSVYPGSEGTARVVLHPPPDEPGGTRPFCLLARSTVEHDESATAEGDVEVTAVDGLTASLAPATSRGRWSGRHALRVLNGGNTPLALAVRAGDPDERLGFLLRPAQLDLLPGGTATVAVRARSRAPFLRGAVVRVPFTVTVAPPGVAVGPARPGAVPDPRSATVAAALEQRAVLSRGVVALALVGVLALAAGGVAAWNLSRGPAPEPLRSTVATPTGVQVVPVAADTVTASWTPGAVDEYIVFLIDPSTQGDAMPRAFDEVRVDGALTQVDVADLPAATQSCVQVAASLAGGTGPRSAPVCATTLPLPGEPPAETTSPPSNPTATVGPGTSPPDPSPTGSTTGPTTSGTTGTTTGPTTGTTTTGPTTGTTTTGPTVEIIDPPAALSAEDWVLVLNVYVVGDGDPGRRAAERVDALTAEGVPAGFLDPAAYPAFTYPNGAAVVYAGPYDDEAAALVARNELGDAVRAGPQQVGESADTEVQ